jgi:hypothetical protein
LLVQAPVVEIVHVALMPDGGVTTAGTVYLIVLLVNVGRHLDLRPVQGRARLDLSELRSGTRSV